jgi:SAM-dependent methyltransferase
MTDPYHNPDALPSSTIEAIITRLEERGRHPFFLSAINQYVATLERDRKLSVLELGCGTGVVIRHVETLVHPTCILRAADISEQFLQGGFLIVAHLVFISTLLRSC